LLNRQGLEMKKINLNWTLYDTLAKYPELEDALYNAGFAGVKNPLMRKTHAKIMSLKKGISYLKIDINKFKEEIKKLGFEIEE
jgi:hypothetical protein